jgi:hypothetical protein
MRLVQGEFRDLAFQRFVKNSSNARSISQDLALNGGAYADDGYVSIWLDVLCFLPQKSCLGETLIVLQYSIPFFFRFTNASLHAC